MAIQLIVNPTDLANQDYNQICSTGALLQVGSPGPFFEFAPSVPFLKFPPSCLKVKFPQGPHCLPRIPQVPQAAISY